MILSDKVFREDEKAIYRLRELYSRYGYSHYRVSKFEEYDMYSRNKSFLISENLLTFTDTNGKLMALKPDVTLSIIKNAVASEKTLYKLYYDEHVYRTTSEDEGFREIMQTGLEAIGNIDMFSQCEVLMLAMRSLESVSDDYLLDISHMRFLEGLLDEAGVNSSDMAEFFSLISCKNTSGIKVLCKNKNISAEVCKKLCDVSAMYLPIESALSAIKPIISGEKMKKAYDELCNIYETMKEYGLSEKLRLDFSVVNDMNYYDGIIFKGFINGIPSSVLSGGRYDKLMERFGKKSSAIGFAVYLDRLERFGNNSDEYDIDIMLVYDNDVSTSRIIEAVRSLSEDGSTVRAVNTPDKSVRCRQILRLGKEGINILETND